MSQWVARPHDDDFVQARRPAVELGPLLGASAVALVVLGILALLAGEGLEPFGGSVSVLAGLLCGAALVVAGLAGVARRSLTRLPEESATRDATIRPRPSDRAQPTDDRARRQRVDETRIMRTVAAGLPPPPSSTPGRGPARRPSLPQEYEDQSPPLRRHSSSRTSA
jgi:hypothetical protein